MGGAWQRGGRLKRPTALGVYVGRTRSCGGAAAGFEVGRDTQVRMFRAFCGVLREMARGLVSQGMTHVVMEATEVCTMPVYHALLEPGGVRAGAGCDAACEECPGRKSDRLPNYGQRFPVSP